MTEHAEPNRNETRARPPLRWLKSLFWPTAPYTNHKRLRNQIESAEIRAKRITEQQISDEIQQNLQRAKNHADGGDTESGWWHLAAALRSEVHSFEQPELSARYEAVTHECAQKLSGWRAASAQWILENGKSIEDPALKKQALVLALFIRDEHFDNLYRNKEIVKQHIGVLAAPLLGGIICFLLVAALWACFGGLTLLFPIKELTSWGLVGLLVGAMFLGLAGSSLSAISGMANSTRVPNQFDHIRITLTRALIGAASGIIAVLVVGAEFFDAFDTVAEAWILAFGFGFTEKLLVGIMDKLAIK